MPATQDAWVYQVDQHANHGSDLELKVKAASNGKKRALVQFDLSSIPSCADVASANLEMFVESNSLATALYHDVNLLMQSWTEAGVTWLSRNGEETWATQGGDLALLNTARVSTGTGSGWLSWDVSADVRSFLCSPAAGCTHFENYGWIIKAKSENSHSFPVYETVIRYASRENGITANRPQLVVTYALNDDLCDDGNVCTDEVCSASSCVHTNNTLSCDDGNACTTNDTCGGGVCVGGAAPSCDDGIVCTDDSCNPGTGCVHTNNTASCDDANACTQTDSCQSGSCSGSNAVVCTASDQCHDVGTCNPATGACSNPVKQSGASCDDGEFCTENDVCTSGVCGGAVRDCSDGLFCTGVDSCDESEDRCDSSGNPCNPVTESCNENTDACEPLDLCSGVVCAPTGSDCTVNVCDPADGVCKQQNVPDSTACNDGNACTTNDTCSAGVCVGGTANCDDDNVCTDDSCSPGTGCVNTDNTASCDDGQFCTVNDVCAAGVCGGSARDCSVAGDQCNLGVCNEGTDACEPGQPTNEGGPCDDGDLCTINDVCSAGVCSGLVCKVAPACDPVPEGVNEWLVNDDTSGTPAGCAVPNFSDIQSAINAATDGDIISVCPGTYPQALSVTKEVWIRSTGGKAVTTVGSGAGAALTLRRSDTRVEGLTVLGATTAVNADSICPPEQATCTAPGEQGWNVRLIDNAFQGNTTGVEWQAKIDCVAIRDNAFVGNARHLDLVQQQPPAAENVVIENNTFDGGGSAGEAVRVSGVGAQLLSNRVSNAVATGMRVGGAKVRVAAGIVENSGAAGIVVEAGPAGMQVLENNIRDNLGDGITIQAGAEGTQIRNNNITDGRQPGTSSRIGLRNQGAVGELDAEENWWGSQLGPTVDLLLATGSRTAVFDEGGSNTKFVEFLCSPYPGGFPSVGGDCRDETPELRQLVIGHAPDTSWGSRYLAVASSEDLNNDPRVTSYDNADGSPEVFFLDRRASSRYGGNCLGGANPGVTCTSRRHCEGTPNSDPPIFDGRCVLITQITNTSGGAMANVRLPKFAQKVIFDTSADLLGSNPDGVSQIVQWDRREFQGAPNAVEQMTGGGLGQNSERSDTDLSARWIVMESAANPNRPGLNADGNVEVFLYDSKRAEWHQVTDTLAPVENGRPIIAGSKTMFFESTGDLDNNPKSNFNNADENRELFRAERRRGPWGEFLVTQLTDTQAPAENFSGDTIFGGNLVAFVSSGNLDNNRNPDGNLEVFAWSRGLRQEGIAQITESMGGENVNPALSPVGRYVMFESTADLEGDGSTNRRVFQFNRSNNTLLRLSRSRFGDNINPRVGRWFVVWESTANLTGENPAEESVVYLLERRKAERLFH